MGLRTERVGSRVRHEGGRRTHRQKRCEYKNKDEGNNLKTLRDKDYQASPQKFKQSYIL